MGAKATYIEAELDAARTQYRQRHGVELPADVTPSKQLQSQLTEPLYRKMFADLVSKASPTDK